MRMKFISQLILARKMSHGLKMPLFSSDDGKHALSVFSQTLKRIAH